MLAIARSEGLFDVARKKKTLDRSAGPTYDAILADVAGPVDAARHAAVRSTNAVMAATYGAIGRRIVEHEQHGAERAGYEEELIERLSSDLQSRFGRGFGRANMFQMRSFYLAYRNILQTPSGESGRRLAQTLICEHTSNIDQLFGEHATTNQMGATPIGVQSGRRFTPKSH